MYKRKITAVFVSVLLFFSFPLPVSGEDENVIYYAAEKAELVFSEEGITEICPGSGYTVEGTVLTVTATGTYRVGGSCSEGSIVVNKGLEGVTLIFDSLDLASSLTAPVVVKKDSSVLFILEGESALTDNEDPALEETGGSFEGACIKAKTGSSLIFYGEGVLNIRGNAKNALKGGEGSSALFEKGTFNISAVNSGIAFDGRVVINGGSFDIDTDGDGIKSDPEETDSVSWGIVEINGGSVAIDSRGDCVQAANEINISGGDFVLKTDQGHGSSAFDPDTMSRKGLKASGSRENDSAAINISGGTFYIKTADDAVHSDKSVSISKGTFTIYTGDDAVHADEIMTLGSEGGLERDPEVFVYSSYEGLESVKINAYSGKYYLVATDDGINSAGGSSNGTDPGGGGHFDPWHPGGGSSENVISFYGGEWYIDCGGDGIDSNGDINMNGGDFTILSQAKGGDNSPLDTNGSLNINGATVFGAGTNPFAERPSNSSQQFYSSNSMHTAGKVLNVIYDGNTVRSEFLPRLVNYVCYSSPSMTSYYCSIGEAQSVEHCKSDPWEHSFDEGTVVSEPTYSSSGKVKYTCEDCGYTEYKTLPKLFAHTVYIESEEGEDPDEGYAVSFVADENVTIDVYYTQDYSSPDETGVTSAVSRNADTGEPDSSGDGQLNFGVVPSPGYEITELSVSGSYKNLKLISEGDEESIYRITKVASELTVTVTAEKVQGGLRVITPAALEGAYTVSDRTVTVTWDYPCRLGYMSEGVMASLESVSNEDGSYSYAVPEGTDEVYLFVKGDANLDGKISNADATKIKACLKGGAALEGLAVYGADTDGNGSVSNADATKIKAFLKNPGSIAW